MPADRASLGLRAKRSRARRPRSQPRWRARQGGTSPASARAAASVAGSGSPGRTEFGDAWGVCQVPLPAAVGVHDEEVGLAVDEIVPETEEEDPPPIRRPAGTDVPAGAVGELSQLG